MFPIETTLQVARLLYDGFFDAYDFDVFLLHMGGLLLVGRINRGRDKSADADALPARSMIEYLRELN